MDPGLAPGNLERSQQGLLSKLMAAIYIKQQRALTLATKLPISVYHKSPQYSHWPPLLFSEAAYGAGPELFIKKLLVISVFVSSTCCQSNCYQSRLLQTEQPEGSRVTTRIKHAIKHKPVSAKSVNQVM